MTQTIKILTLTLFFLLMLQCDSRSQDHVMDEIENERREREKGVAFEKSLIKLSVKRIKEIIKVVDDDSLAIVRFVMKNKDGKYEESIKNILDSNIQDIIQYLEKVDDKCRPFEKCFIRDIEYSEDAKNLFLL